MKSVLKPSMDTSISYRVDIVVTAWKGDKEVDLGRIWHYTISADQFDNLQISYDRET